MKHSEIMIAIREMNDTSDDDWIARKDKKMLENQGWKVIMFSRDFAFWAKIAKLLAPPSIESSEDLKPWVSRIPNGQLED